VSVSLFFDIKGSGLRNEGWKRKKTPAPGTMECSARILLVNKAASAANFPCVELGVK